MKLTAKWVPIVFTMASAVGVEGTAVLTAKCTTKAEKMLAGRRENDGNTKETVIDICRCYAPAIACGTEFLLTNSKKPSQWPVCSPERALDGTSQRLRNSMALKLTSTSSTSYAKKI